MRDTSARIGLSTAFVMLGLTACFSLGRNAPPDRHYVLGGAQPAEGRTPSGDSANLSIGLRRLDLAAYLATPLIVVRRGPQRITFSEYHRWGEDLDAGINRAVAGYLAARSPVDRVDVAPWPPRTHHDYLIQLHVVRFEGVAPEELSAVAEVHILATWEIIRQHDGAVLARGTTDHREPGWRVDDYDGLVTLLDRGLDLLSHDLVTCLDYLGTTATLARGERESMPLPAPRPARPCFPPPD